MEKGLIQIYTLFTWGIYDRSPHETTKPACSAAGRGELLSKLPVLFFIKVLFFSSIYYCFIPTRHIKMFWFGVSEMDIFILLSPDKKERVPNFL